jgi:ABC-type polysaccharide/polyol phosphate transport system ATPase subunit
MSDIAIRFDRVSKRYRLHRGWYFSIRDELSRLFQQAAFGERRQRDEFWALKDVSFDVRRGETLGLIGANGAGKSTTLKILSRVTVPTTGTFTARGKIGSIIEIGAGFHPELSGRENVYLNGAVMGMSRREIEAKFESIVAFSGVEQFIDTPIKFYSSGMMVRLGFAVAAHTDPDILLVDEVLAVGDAAFQAKCLNKLAELKESDKTVVLVSHAMSNILQHSNRALWIDHGQVREWGDPDRVVETYLRAALADEPHHTSLGDVSEDAPILVREVVFRDVQGRRTDVLEYGAVGSIDVAYEVRGLVSDPVISIGIHDVYGHLLGAVTTRLDDVKIDTTRERGMARLVLAPVLFTRGAYTVSVTVFDEHIRRYLDLRSHAGTFRVEGPSESTREVSGHVVYPHRWEVGGE